MARRGAGTDTPPENPRRVTGLVNVAAVCLIGSLIGVHWSLTLFAILACPAVGSAPRSGRGGRRFKSCHSDQGLAEIPTSTGTDCGTVSSDPRAALAEPRQ